MRKIKWNSNLKQRILLGSNILVILACMILNMIGNQKVSHLYSQQAAQRWEYEDEIFAQVSAFFSPEKNMQVADVKEIRNSLMRKLKDDSFYDKNRVGRTLIDSYYGECDTQIRKDGNTLSVTAVGIGNDFFQFHPMKLLSGTYISGQDINYDRVILDENLAWALFGSNNIVGMKIWMNENIYLVAGVVALEKDDVYQNAYGTQNRMYMMYDTLKQHNQNLRIQGYEAVMPNPIQNYAFYALKEACGYEDMNELESVKKDRILLNFGDCEIIENTNRFHPIKLLRTLPQNKYQMMRTNNVGYPYWENVARVVVFYKTRITLLIYMLLSIPLVSCILCVCRYWGTRTWSVRGVLGKAFEYIQTKLSEKKDKTDELEGVIDTDFELIEVENQIDQNE